MKILANRIDLGLTRIAGFNLYCSESRAFEETTPKDVKALIKRNQVNGLKLVNGEIVLDTEGFNMRNLMVKSGVGKYRSLFPADTMVNCMYAVVRVIDTDNGRIYETVNNKCARVKVTPEKLNMLMEMGYVAGVKKNDKGVIEICKGVTIEDKRTNNEQPIDQSPPAVPEVEQHLDDSNVVMESVSSEVGNNCLQSEQSLSGADADGEPDEAVNTEVETSFEKVDIIDTKFYSLDLTELPNDLNISPDEASSTSDYTEENKVDDQSPEHVGEEKKVSNRKTTKKK